ncbi:MAG: DUF885 family protein, partial [Blastocatellia bacterium]|nr:DUF885 family protein [Blastocatellia bacterium]
MYKKLVIFVVAVLVLSFYDTGASGSGYLDGNSPDLAELDTSRSEMRAVIERYTVDRGSLTRSYPVEISAARQARFKQFYSDWLALIAKMNFDAMSQDGKVDYLLFKNHLEHELLQLEIERKSLAEIVAFVPFAQTVIDLAESRRRMETIDSARIAAQLNEMNKQVEAARKAVEASLKADPAKVKKSVANRALNSINVLRNTLRIWFAYYNAYDPLFTWWVDEPYKAVDQSLGGYASFLAERVLGVRPVESAPVVAEARRGDGTPGGRGGRGGLGGASNARAGDASDIIGDPIGREVLLTELSYEMIPYTPEELIAIGYKELEWCESEMKKASRELGYGDDWRKALEYVKNKYVEPGKQPDLIKSLAFEAIDYVEKNNLVTVPP